MTLGAPRVMPLPLRGQRPRLQPVPGREVWSSTICLCLIRVVEGPDKTVLQVLLGQLDPLPEWPQELPGNPYRRSEKFPQSLSLTQEVPGRVGSAGSLTPTLFGEVRDCTAQRLFSLASDLTTGKAAVLLVHTALTWPSPARLLWPA